MIFYWIINGDQSIIWTTRKGFRFYMNLSLGWFNIKVTRVTEAAVKSVYKILKCKIDYTDIH